MSQSQSMNPPKISIITPAYKCAPYIRKCIESVLAQGYPNFEHIIMDAASNDGTVEILREYPHLIWVSEPDRGEADALNKAMLRVTGDVVNWLNADDYMAPNVLPLVAAKFAEPGTDVVYGNTDFVDEAGHMLWHKRSDARISMPALLRFWENARHFHQPSIFYRREVLETVGPFSTTLHFSIDYEQWLRVMRRYEFSYLDATLSCALVRDNAKSSDNVAAQHRSHWQVSRPYRKSLSAGQRKALLRDYLRVCWWPDTSIPIRARLRLGTKLRRLIGRKSVSPG